MIEAALRTHLIEQETLVPYMGTWQGQMAIFNQEAPPDTDPGWNLQYGRIVFMVDMTGDPERQVGATLAVDVMCEKECQDPNEMEPIVRNLIDGYFFVQDGNTVGAKWRKSNYFAFEANEKVIGVTLLFDLLAFPKMITAPPDPVARLNGWSGRDLARKLDKTVRVIGMDDEEMVAWKPTAENPAIYWRISQISKCSWIPDTFNAIWQDATLMGHVFAGDVNTEMSICRIINNVLQRAGSLILDDGSPLFVDRNIKIVASNDPLRTGQISVIGTYGILREHPHADPIQHITTRGEYHG